MCFTICLSYFILVGFTGTYLLVAPVYSDLFLFNDLIMHTFLFYGHWKFILQSSSLLKVFVCVCVCVNVCACMHNSLFLPLLFNYTHLSMAVLLLQDQNYLPKLFLFCLEHIAFIYLMTGSRKYRLCSKVHSNRTEGNGSTCKKVNLDWP